MVESYKELSRQIAQHAKKVKNPDFKKGARLIADFAVSLGSQGLLPQALPFPETTPSLSQEPSEELVSLQQAADEIHVSRSALSQRIARGQLQPVQVGNYAFLTRSVVTELRAAYSRANRTPVESLSASSGSQLEELVSLPQATAEIGVSSSAISKRIERGAIQSVRIGGHRFLTRSTIEDLKQNMLPRLRRTR